MRVRHRGGGAIGLLVATSVIASCSFLSDFPDVVPAEGEGGAGSSGSATTTTGAVGGGMPTGSTVSSASASPTASSGGGQGSGAGSGNGGQAGAPSYDCQDPGGAPPSCDDGICQDCYADEGCACPDGELSSTNLYGHEFAESDPEYDSSAIRITQVLPGAVGGTLLVGQAATFWRTTTFEADGTTYESTSRGLAFVTGRDGVPLVLAGSCGVDADEVIFLGATELPGVSRGLAVAGLFQSAGLQFFDPEDTMDCDPRSYFVGTEEPGGATTQPILALLDDRDTARRLWGPVTPVNGYMTDAAAIPDEEAGRVVAVGLASNDPFDPGAAPFDGNGEFFLVAADDENMGPRRQLGVEPCIPPGPGDHWNTLHGRWSSVDAVPLDNGEWEVWVAGTGCPIGDLGTQQSFLMRTEVREDETIATIDPFDDRVFTTDDDGDGQTESWMAISELAVDANWVVVAGTYNNMPSIGVNPIGHTGFGDGFVAAFVREGWSTGDPPVWFTRLDGGTDQATAEVEDLILDGDRILVAGSAQEFADITTDGSEMPACSEGLLTTRSRAFFAELDPDTGSPRWYRVEGNPPVEDEWAAMLGTAIALEGEDVTVATATNGEMRFECGAVGDVVPGTAPLARARTLAGE